MKWKYCKVESVGLFLIKLCSLNFTCYVYRRNTHEESRNKISEEFYRTSQETTNYIKKNDYIIPGGDLDAWIQNIPTENIIGNIGENTINQNVSMGLYKL